MTEYKERFWQEGVDGKRLALHLLHHVWLILAAAAAGALVCAGIYLPVKTWKAGAAKYAAVSQYYITFNTDEFGKVYDYYNAYTWEHDVITCDAITEYALQYLPESVTKEQLKESVTAKLPGDERFMTVTVATQDPALSDLIQEAYMQTLPHFAEITKGLGTITLTQWEPAKEVPVDYKTGSALFLGALLGLGFSLFALLLWYGLDDSFYVEEDLRRRFPYPVLGQITAKQDAAFLRELAVNAGRLLPAGGGFAVAGTQEAAVLSAAETLKALQEKIRDDVLATDGTMGGAGTGFAATETADSRDVGKTARTYAAFPTGARVGALTEADYEAMRSMDGVILALPYGGRDGRAAAHLAAQLEKQGCAVCGMVLTGGKDWFLKRYYGKKRFDEERSRRDPRAEARDPGMDEGSL